MNCKICGALTNHHPSGRCSDCVGKEREDVTLDDLQDTVDKVMELMVDLQRYVSKQRRG